MASSSKRVRKAVIPVAGLGTRFLPATKVLAKEMLTIVDRPALQYVVDEAWEAGIEHVCFVTGRGKGVIEDHFDRNPELEDTLEARGKTKPLEQLRAELPEAGRVSFVRQQAPLGLGHAVWCARDIIGDEPFALMLPDMIMTSDSGGCLSRMMTRHGELGGNMIAVEEVPWEEVSSYGVVALGKEAGDEKGEGVARITGMVEKPKREDAPSNLYISGRYILQPEIFGHLSRHETGTGGEIQVTDAMHRLMEDQDFWSYAFEGRTFDTGSKIGFLTANLAFGLERPELADELRAEAKALLGL
ncbi:MAG: UTP--glucose-1-phosphate uridylyltransferase [Pseudomonadota bacterium]